MTGDWRDYRPAIWTAMLGLALALAINPPYVGAGVLGVAIGLAIRVRQARRRRRS
jgi:4-amino-4-deoxy-L-arabinose transferase-like glycosyltransferase